MHYLSDYDFSALLKTAKDKKYYQRLMILAYLKNGMSQAETARLLFISSQTVSTRLKRFTQDGLDGLKDKAKSGRPRILDAKEHDALKEKIESAQSELTGGRIRGANPGGRHHSIN